MSQFNPLKDIIEKGKSKRIDLINLIESKLDGNVITYISNLNDPFCLIEHQDIELLMDLIGSIDRKDNLYLILSSIGGDINAAEKIITLCRDFCDSFFVIIPMLAKSAATIIALGSDTILMGSCSEIGPIDVQIVSLTPRGSKVVIPARTFAEAYEFLQNEILVRHRPPQMIMPMLLNIDPIMLQNCKNQLRYGFTIAEKWLKKHMWKEDENKAIEIAKCLNEDFISHGAVINYQEASEIGLKIRYLPIDSEEWKLIWEYYIISIYHLNQTQKTKLFESRNVSLNRKVFVKFLPTPPPGAITPQQ